MPTPEQFQAAQDRELEGIRAALERALEVNAEVLASLASLGRGRKSKRNKKHRRKGTRARRRSRRH